ncbi:MAG: twin-arginine translocation signal domain-containing protein [Sphingomonadaceae bacterium]
MAVEKQMMPVSRRSLLKISAAAGAVLGVPAAQAWAASRPALVIHDSRLRESDAFIAAWPHIRRIDIAAEEARMWVGIRTHMAGYGRVEGLTRWSDWVQLRGALQEKGLRVSHESHIPSHQAGLNDLFRWTLQHR